MSEVVSKKIWVRLTKHEIRGIVQKAIDHAVDVHERQHYHLRDADFEVTEVRHTQADGHEIGTLTFGVKLKEKD